MTLVGRQFSSGIRDLPFLSAIARTALLASTSEPAVLQHRSIACATRTSSRPSSSRTEEARTPLYRTRRTASGESPKRKFTSETRSQRPAQRNGRSPGSHEQTAKKGGTFRNRANKSHSRRELQTLQESTVQKSRRQSEDLNNREDAAATKIFTQQPKNDKDSKMLLGKSLEELQAIVESGGLPKYRGKQLYDGILKGAKSLNEISNIPAAMKGLLGQKGFSIGRSVLQQSVLATDGTRKFLMQLHDGRVVEAVGIPNEKDSRLTACISSQVGCAMRCTFCATGKGGFARNLMPHEIVDQLLTVQEQFGTRVSNVVFMGMGEPMLNLRSVLAANHFIAADIGIGARHITISSVGVPNTLIKLASQQLQNTLAISIHAPTQELRETIVPSARSYPLEALMLDCQKYFEVTGRRITFEYTLMAGVNDSTTQAGQLASLLKRFDLRGHVNLIPWNPVDESEFQRPSRAAVQAFADTLTEGGVPTSIRVTRGLEAAAACGQLRNQHQVAQKEIAAAA